MKYRDHNLSLSASRIRLTEKSVALEMCESNGISIISNNKHNSNIDNNNININNNLIVSSMEDDLKKLVKHSKSDKSLDTMSEGIDSTDGEAVSCCSSLSCSSTSVAALETGSCSFGYGSLQTNSGSVSGSPSPRSATPSSRPESRSESRSEGRKSYQGNSLTNDHHRRPTSNSNNHCSSPSDLRTVSSNKSIANLNNIETWPSTGYTENDETLLWTNQGSKVNLTTNQTIKGILVQPMSCLQKELLLWPGSKIPLRRYTSELNLTSSCSGQNIISPEHDIPLSRTSSSSVVTSPCSSPASSSSPVPCSRYSHSFKTASSSLHRHQQQKKLNRRRHSDLELNQIDKLISDSWFDEWSKPGKFHWWTTSGSTNCDQQSDDGYSSASSPGESLGRESGSISLYELKKLRQSRYQSRYKSKILWSPRTRSKLLIQRIRLSNPVSVAMQLTTIDKDLYLQIRPTEMASLLLGRRKKFESNDLSGIRTLLEFSEEVKKLVSTVINRETTPESQARKIAAFIEVACVLRKLRNWHSLSVIIKALQSPSIYFLEMAWLQTKEQFPIHFSDFVRLSSLVKLCDKYVLRMSKGKTWIPNFGNILSYLEIQCAAKIDLCENKPKWVEPPSIAGWLNNQLVEDIIRNRIGLSLSCQEDQQDDNEFTATLTPDKTTLIPNNEPIRFIAPSSLPIPWRVCETRSLSSIHRKPVTCFVLTAFEEELRNIRRYKMRKNPA